MNPEHQEDKYFVGAKKMPDGSLDVSKAMEWRPQPQNSEDSIETKAEKFINKMTSSPEKNEKREKAFDGIASAHARLKLLGNLAVSFAELVNEYLHPVEPISPEDISSIQFIDHPKEIEILESQLNKKFNRPIIIMDFADYPIFFKKLTGISGTSGCNIRVGDAGMIISTPRPDFIYHELRHSVDPNFHERTGDDKILEEFVAFYGDVINPSKSTITTRGHDKNGKMVEKTEMHILKTEVKELARKVKTDVHHQQCCPHLTFEEYCALADRVTGILVEISQKFNELELQNILFNSRTISDLEAVLQSKTILEKKPSSNESR